jgi:adenylate cyclase
MDKDRTSPMSSEIKKLAILFADISGSTALYEKLGDQNALPIIARCLTILKSTLTKHKGTLIKTIGDEILCTFPTPEEAMNAACAMQVAVKADNHYSEHAMYIRVGFHYGDVICEDNDIYGDAVNVAARVTAITRANQIMTTTAVFEMLPYTLHDKIRKILRADIKGKQEKFDIHQILWEQEDMSTTRIGMSIFRKPQLETKELILRYRGHTYTLNEQNRKLLLGRDDSCHIVVKSDFASRQHANIELKSGNFVLFDHSSNGTYVRNNNNAMVRLNHEDIVLHSTGVFSLGQPYSENPLDVIEFSISPSSYPTGTVTQ